MENKDVLSYIMQYLQKEDAEHITIEDDSFIVRLSEHNAHGFWKRGSRLVGLILVSIVVLAFIVYSAVFYCKNVLFYQGELSINQFGAFTPRKSYSSEYAMYLFDAREQWRSSGIQVQKGDRLFIAASGAFHTNYRELVNAAKNNLLANEMRIKEDTLLHTNDTACLRWVYATHKNSLGAETINRKYVGTYKKQGQPFEFGDILFQVVPEYQISNGNYSDIKRIYKIPTPDPKKRYRNPIEIWQDGVLAFMVNDNKPENNIGQILVGMEIFRYSDSFFGAFWSGKSHWGLDMPYYYYELLKHENRSFLAILVYACMAILQLIVLCIFAYYLPIIMYYLTYFVLHPKQEYQRLKKWFVR